MRFIAPLSSLVLTTVVVNASTTTNTTCICTSYSQIASAVASCTHITLQDIYVPGNDSLDLSKLQPNSVVTFAGLTAFGFTNSSGFTPISFGGNNVTITAEPDAIIDGNGQLYWDGLGSNGGLPKPNRFINVKMSNNSIITDLHIRNWPAHLFGIGSSSNLTLQNLLLDNSAGDAPNNRSKGLAAAHNSDGIGVQTSSNILLTNITVHNQDDCVAITSGDKITVSNMFCEGSHGLSIGSIGGKSDNNVTNILFTNSTILNSENGARIKSNFNTTGFISNITYSNIRLTNISTFGIDIQEDYLNGGATGTPSNGVIIENILFDNVTGNVVGNGRNYYVLCGEGSCSNVEFRGVNITGGGKNSSCNFPDSGCPI